MTALRIFARVSKALYERLCHLTLPRYLLAVDHRAQLVEECSRLKVPQEQIAVFKTLVVDAWLEAAASSDLIRAEGGLILDDEWGSDAIARARRSAIPVAQPVEIPGSVPLRLYDDYATRVVRRRPAFIKCLVQGGPHQPPDLYEAQNRTLEQLYWVCERAGVPLTLELITPEGPGRADGTARWMTALAARGVRPAYWKLQAFEDPRDAAHVSAACQKPARIIILGKSAPLEVLGRHFEATRGLEAFCGFAVGRTIFSQAFTAHLKGAPARATVHAISDGYVRVMNLWASARRGS